ncbi:MULTISPECIES: hypothetical protein [Paenibacillus]|uniref:Alpha/beta hydrolase n=1 Tax=Paenibacillus borealis TaxID=160799 RepID=A0ABX3H250_PAEBO|nr:hypothetical protein [Paenibacillus borealis]OMD44498.1 hypothetical protein BSK56_22565 [Paenibacillus borealis]
MGNLSIKKMEQTVKKAGSDLGNATNTIINNTVSDIRNILSNLGDCASAIDNIRLRATHRAIQYHTSVARILKETEVYPVELIERIYNSIADLLKIPDSEVEIRLYHLINPGPAVWESQPRDMQVIDPDTISLPQDRVPFVFIHGVENQGETDAFEFYKKFEKSAWMYNHNVPGVDYSSVDIYIVSYDAKISNENHQIIKSAFESAGVIVDGDAPGMFAAVMWKEWVRRARLTSDKIMPFLNKMKYLPHNYRGLAVTHSLGCEVMANAGHRLIENDPDLEPAFIRWWCMAAALPSDAFSNTGLYPSAPRIAMNYPLEKPGTTVWFSASDSLLSTLYFIANDHFAMGQTGAHMIDQYAHYINNDVTLCVLEAHMTDTYFPRLGTTIRKYLGTQIWSEDPNSDCALEDIFRRD